MAMPALVSMGVDRKTEQTAIVTLVVVTNYTFNCDACLPPAISRPIALFDAS
jgi:hypothetical protein